MFLVLRITKYCFRALVRPTFYYFVLRKKHDADAAMNNDCDNRTATGNHCDNHTAMENGYDNHIESVQHPSCVTYLNDDCDNASNSISTMSSNNMASSFIRLSTKEGSVTNVTLTTKTVQSLIDEEVELTKRWTPTLKIEKSINTMLCQNTDVISLI